MYLPRQLLRPVCMHGLVNHDAEHPVSQARNSLPMSCRVVCSSPKSSSNAVEQSKGQGRTLCPSDCLSRLGSESRPGAGFKPAVGDRLASHLAREEQCLQQERARLAPAQVSVTFHRWPTARPAAKPHRGLRVAALRLRLVAPGARAPGKGFPVPTADLFRSREASRLCKHPSCG
jgi:hypothetical protein